MKPIQLWRAYRREAVPVAWHVFEIGDEPLHAQMLICRDALLLDGGEVFHWWNLDQLTNYLIVPRGPYATLYFFVDEAEGGPVHIDVDLDPGYLYPALAPYLDAAGVDYGPRPADVASAARSAGPMPGSAPEPTSVFGQGPPLWPAPAPTAHLDTQPWPAPGPSGPPRPAAASGPAAAFGPAATTARAANHAPATNGGLAFPPGPAPRSAAASFVDEIERLSRLHDAGSLTDEEFRAAKAHLLGLA
jgi:Short C-terminal domain